MSNAWITVLTLAFTSLVSAPCQSQQVSVGTPLRGVRTGFFEHWGVGFGFRHATPNSMMFFQHGNGMSAMPPFGGFDAANASTFGMGGRHGDWTWNLNVSALQGYGSSHVSTVPTLTLPNGGFGLVQNTVQRPFVIGYVPIVNDAAEQLAMKRQHYENSARSLIHERTLQQERAADELDRLKHESKQALRRKESTSKPSEPPLILGRESTGGSYGR